MHTIGTGRPVALMIPSAKNAAVRSSMRTCNLINPRLDAAKNASESGAFLDPGETTTSVMPASIIWRTITRARLVELFISVALRFS